MTQGQDLLTGSVPKKLIRFAFPLFLANLLQALYNVVDMLVVGKIVGKTGLAAISNASMLCFIINSICIGLTMGGSVLVAQCKGANDQTGQRDTIGMLFFLSLVGSAVVAILGLAIYEALFQALNVPANAYQDACGYMKIICCGTVFVFGYNAVCSILKGLGDSQTPLFFVGVATGLNVVLDVLLVGPLSMGTAGAAWATITAQGVSFMASLVYLRRYQPGFSLRKIEFHREKLLAILKVGLPTAIQMVVVNTAYLLVTGMLNQFGTPVAAASGVGLKINTFAVLVLTALARVRRREEEGLFGRRLDEGDIFKAFSVSIMYFMTCMLGCMVLCLDGISMDAALFESLSAMGTVGLTTGITPTLTPFSQGLLILLMYMGRVGILSFSIAFITGNRHPAKIKYPEMNVMIG